jgi:hypothetical protein
LIEDLRNYQLATLSPVQWAAKTPDPTLLLLVKIKGLPFYERKSKVGIVDKCP